MLFAINAKVIIIVNKTFHFLFYFSNFVKFKILRLGIVDDTYFGLGCISALWITPYFTSFSTSPPLFFHQFVHENIIFSLAYFFNNTSFSYKKKIEHIINASYPSLR